MAGRKSMRSSRRLTLRWNWQRRLVSLVVLIGVCAAMLPLPIGWQTRSSKDLSQPFPCQSRPCGCKSADQCWKKCCCFNNAQKLAWAEKNHVTAPAYVTVAAAKERQDAVCRIACCGVKHATESTAQYDGQVCGVHSRTCCNLADRPVKAREPTVDSESELPETKLVLSMFFQNCQGSGWFWNSLPWGVVDEHADAVSQFAVAGDRVRQLSQSLPLQSLQPPVPPPRIAAGGSILS